MNRDFTGDDRKIVAYSIHSDSQSDVDSDVNNPSNYSSVDEYADDESNVSNDGSEFDKLNNYSAGNEKVDSKSIVPCSDNDIPLKKFNFVNGVIVPNVLVSTKTSVTKSSFDQKISKIKFHCFSRLLKARDEMAGMYI